MQYIVSRCRVIEYCTKYVTKSEPRSQSLKHVFTTIVCNLKEDNNSLKAVQKLLINSVGERDYSAQETCHHLLQLPMFKASRDFIVLSLDGSRLEFTRQYTMPKTVGSEPSRRNKSIVVIPRPHCSPDPTGPKDQQYCRQSLMQHKSFRQLNDLLDDSDSYVEAYASFLQSGLVPPCLEEDIHRLQQQHADQISEERSNPDVCVLACIILGAYEPPKAARSVQIRIIAWNGVFIYSST